MIFEEYALSHSLCEAGVVIVAIEPGGVDEIDVFFYYLSKREFIRCGFWHLGTLLYLVMRLKRRFHISHNRFGAIIWLSSLTRTSERSLLFSFLIFT